MTTDKDQPVYLIDGNAYIHRAYHAIAPLSNSKGLPTHAAFGFTNILLRVIKERQPRYLAIAFDSKGPTFRHDLYPDYKANRPPMPDDLVVQIPYIKKIVEAYNIPTLEESGVEADDLLAAAAKRLAGLKQEVVVVSGDKDLLQLVSPRIKLWDPMKDKIMDEQAVCEKYQVPPEHLNDLFALIGDSSDNVPGIPGVGPKTAGKLIAEHHNLENLYAHVDGFKKSKLKERLIDNKEMAFLSRQLTALKSDLQVPAELENYTLPSPDQEKLHALFSELEFSRLLQESTPISNFSTDQFQIITDQAELIKILAEIAKGNHIVLDTETDSLDPLVANLVGVSFCTNADKAYYVPVGHRDQDHQLVAGQIPLQSLAELLEPIFANRQICKIGHNLKYDYAVLNTNDMPLQGPFCDTMLASYLLTPTSRTHKLDDLANQLLQKKMTTFQEVTNGDKRADSFCFVELEAAKNYSCEDVAAAFALWKLLKPQLEEQKLQGLFERVECRLIPILAEMEGHGVQIDKALLKELSHEFGQKLDELSTRIYELAREEFNINSTKQLAEILFEKLGLPHGRKTKTGYSTDIKVLEKLGRIHELPRSITEHRNISKLKSTYVDKLHALVHPKTGRVHTSFNQAVTATGRLSSSDPNLQNIPIRTEEGQRIRQAFIPSPGHLFLSADYSQIDLRVLAHYADDEALIEAFCSGEDIHRSTAAEIFRINPEFITAEMRRVAKSINFGIVYGMSAFGLSEQLGISRKDAATFIDRYFDHFKGVKKFMEEIVAKAREQGYVTTLLGRRRQLPDINSSNKNRRDFAERTALNTPIQGTAADIIKLATIAVDDSLKAHQSAAFLVLQIHDELILEVPEGLIPETKELVRGAMENVLKLTVPLTVNISTGENLAKA